LFEKKWVKGLQNASRSGEIGNTDATIVAPASFAIYEFLDKPS
jgi:hypothetical protein